MARSPAWQRKAGKSKSGGLNKKGVASYRKANPGSKLQTAVTTILKALYKDIQILHNSYQLFKINISLYHIL